MKKSKKSRPRRRSRRKSRPKATPQTRANVSPPGNASAPTSEAGSTATPAAGSIRAQLRPRRTLVGYSRLRWLYEELRAGKNWNTPDLVKELGVVDRTVRRDIKALQIEFQQDVRFDVERNSYYLVDPDRPLPHVPVTQGELFMFCLAQEALGAQRDSRFAKVLQAGITKMAASLDKRLEGGLAELTKSICFRTTGGATVHDPVVFDTIAEAVAARRELFCDYRPLGKVKAIRRRVRPRCLVRLDGTWYVLTHQTGSRRELTLALARMSNLRLGTETFPPEEGITLREKLESSIGIFGGTPERVRLRLDGPASRVTGEQCLHTSHRILFIDEDASELTMEVAVNAELERWILGWGDCIEVLEPPALREKIAARLQRAAARHAQPLPAPVEAPPAAAGPGEATAEPTPAAADPACSEAPAPPPEEIPAESAPRSVRETPAEPSLGHPSDSPRAPSEVPAGTSEGPREDLPTSPRAPLKVPAGTLAGPGGDPPTSLREP